tara:strand:- start:817 stop:993 length:177 start_codon:yes stop_codon:yes gene_type:complete
MRIGDLVEVFGYDRHGDLDNATLVGILMGWDHSDEGWVVLIDGQIQVYPKTWWRCRRA